MDENLIIRDATTDDIAGLTLLMNELGYLTTATEMQIRFSQIIGHSDYKTIVAAIDNEVVAMAGLIKGMYYEKNGGYVRVVAFVVKQSCRNKGIGKILIKAAEDWAVLQDCHTMLLTSRKTEERRAAYAFYQKSGYEIRSSGFVKQLR